MLCSLIFACDGLDWSPIDHLETFAGHMAVTKAEMQVGLFQQETCISIQTKSLKNTFTVFCCEQNSFHCTYFEIGSI